MRGPGRKEGKGHDGRHGTGGEHGLQIMGVPPANATVDDVPDAVVPEAPVDVVDDVSVDVVPLVLVEPLSEDAEFSVSAVTPVPCPTLSESTLLYEGFVGTRTLI